MWPHNGAIVTNKLLTWIAEVSQRLIVQETLLLEEWIHLVGTWVGITSSKHCTEWTLWHWCSEWHTWHSIIRLRWLSIINLRRLNRHRIGLLLLSWWSITYLYALLALCIIISFSWISIPLLRLSWLLVTCPLVSSFIRLFGSALIRLLILFLLLTLGWFLIVLFIVLLYTNSLTTIYEWI